MNILGAEDHAFFAENGYVIVPNAVPQENLDAVMEACASDRWVNVKKMSKGAI